MVMWYKQTFQKSDFGMPQINRHCPEAQRDTMTWQNCTLISWVITNLFVVHVIVDIANLNFEALEASSENLANDVILL